MIGAGTGRGSRAGVIAPLKFVRSWNRTVDLRVACEEPCGHGHPRGSGSTLCPPGPIGGRQSPESLRTEHTAGIASAGCHRCRVLTSLSVIPISPDPFLHPMAIVVSGVEVVKRVATGKSGSVVSALKADCIGERYRMVAESTSPSCPYLLLSFIFYRLFGFYGTRC
ncbi:hypothetical protein B296_00003521 [Ensete ventricosum]|uniref:Uncharacterized protein n=1 Tax=Ensete ventricosum TaxID=4639 RepID=A0A427AN34_ENSVE|nr:hypothetical protein B296_00003521 [Ensete ventricosum]